jgi:predicted RNA-binding Zn-ribbon protein involved in translation (DUF1610 family)
MLTQDGSLATARLEAVPFEIHVRCECGFEGVLGHDDVIDAVAMVCPSCGRVAPRARTAELELLEVRLAPTTAPQHPSPSEPGVPAR